MAEGNENNSVGKISLDLEVTSDLNKQIGEVANKLGKQLSEAFTNSTKGLFDGLSESINSSMKSINEAIKTSLDEMRANTKAAIDSIAEVSKDIKTPIHNISKPTGKTTGAKTDQVSPMIPEIKVPDVTSSLKNGLDNVTQKVRSTITSALSAIKNIKMPKINFPKIEDTKPNTNAAISQPSTRGPPKIIDTTALTAQIDSAARELDIVNAKIEQQQAKLARLKEQYSNTFNETRKNRLEEQILRTESAINGLINKSDKLGFKLADMDAKLASAGKGAGEAASKINLLGKTTGTFRSLANSTANMSKRLGESLKSLGSSCKSTSKHMSNMHYSLGNIIRQFFTWMVVLPLVMKGLESMASGLLADLKTNDQFNQSLNQIKTNLMVTFTPIFYAILPAINALMSALATATTYIASFISAIFGKTYQQSYQATQGLIDAKNAMGAYGDSAKKAAKDALGLAGFDEINKLSKSDSGADNSKVPTLTQPSIDTSQVDSKMQALVNKLKEILGKIFDPMVEAWNAEGKNTIDAFKYALDSIWQLAKDIGKTFLDVWDNGTGVKVCTDILKLLQVIFNIIGDIAKAFKTAWDNGDLGKQVVQALFDAFDSILRLLTTIGQVFRDVWNSGIGVEICTNILEILKNIFTIIGQVADSFNKAFQSDVGKKLVEDILDLLNGCLRIIQDITSSFSKAWESNGDTVVNAILTILDDIVGTISDIANKWSNAWESNGTGDALMDSLLSTLGKILGVIGDVGQGIRESLGKAADDIFPTIIQFATKVSDGIGNLADGFKAIWDNGGKTLFDGIVQLIEQVAKLVMVLAGNAFKDFAELFKELSPAIGLVCDALGIVIGWIADFIGWLVEGATSNGQLKDALIQEWGEISTAAGQKWDEIKTSLGQKWEEIKTSASTKFGEVKTYIGQKWDETKNDASTKWESIKTTLAEKWQLITTASNKTWDDIKDYVSKKWDAVNKDASDDWETIKTTLSKKWDSITKTSSDTWDNIKKYINDKWTEINTDAPGLWDQIKTTLTGKWNEIATTSQGVWNGIVTFLNTTFSGSWSDAWNGLKNIVSDAFKGLEGIVKKPINAIITMVNGLIDGLNSIKIDIPDKAIFGKYAGTSFGIHIPHVPALATGGIIDSPTLAMVGEAGKEAVMPLENNTGWIDDLAGKIAGKIGGNNSSGSTQNSSGDVIFMLDSDVIGKIAIDQLRKAQRQGKITVIPI
ncbi:hypothetical protein ACUH7Y_09645 [Clostridium beijerinckii]|uniref:Uncharacterized protein n=1 Tax=Clostridium beijerinckii TaxID=1520 RepID=A0A7X9SMF4_CLOBE|nr:hypothetical protein [Clostridium beijerinckii]NMF04574.1 hypothetical protein [Clostridium beijerinckii]